MQQFVVPQFIDVEDKIFGPITTRQFLILLVAGGIIFLAYRFADTALFILLTLLFGGGSLIIAFVKVNGQAFHFFLLNLIQTKKTPHLRVWTKSFTKGDLEYLRKLGTEIKVEEKKEVKIVQRKHIRNLSLQVNTGGFYRADEEF